jgi:ComF family protein
MNLLNQSHELRNGIEQLLNLFYPNLCIVCEQRTHSKDELFCLNCQYHIHPTEMYFKQENEFTNHFKGRLNLLNGAAMYYYTKGGRIQKAIELLKYKNRPEIGLRFGRFYGDLLKAHHLYSNIDLIIPVPLHFKRKIQRGYNQSFLFACGIAEVLKIPVHQDLLVRKKETFTQTEKNRIERSANMLLVFELIKPEVICGKHVLLVDDVLTTGATLEACANVLQKAGHVRLSMATIAIAT